MVRLPWSGPAARQEAGHPATKGARQVAGRSAAAAAKATKGAPPFGRKDDVKEEKCLHRRFIIQRGHKNQRESGAVTVKRPSEGGNEKRNPQGGEG